MSPWTQVLDFKIFSLINGCLATGTVKNETDLPEGRTMQGSIGYDGLIYIIGGWPDRNTVWTYNPQSKTYNVNGTSGNTTCNLTSDSPGVSLPKANHRFGLARLDN